MTGGSGGERAVPGHSEPVGGIELRDASDEELEALRELFREAGFGLPVDERGT